MISFMLVSQRDNKGETERWEVIINYYTPQWSRTVGETPDINQTICNDTNLSKSSSICKMYR